MATVNSTSSTTTSPSTNRLTGMLSGLDTDSLVSALVSTEKLKVNKAKQQKQKLEWQRDSYREVTSKFMSFSDKYFNTLKSSTNIRSTSSFARFNIESSNEAVVTATANADASAKTHSITVSALATASKVTGTAGVADVVKGSNAVGDFALSGKQISVNLDGLSKTINLEDYTDIGGLETGLEQKLTDAFGAGKFDVVTTDGKVEVKSNLNGSLFSLSGTGLTSLGFDEGDNRSNVISLTSKLDSIKNNFTNDLNVTNSSENVTFTINGTTIDVGKTYADATLNDVMNAINISNAGVKMTYDSLNDQFSLESTTKGVASGNITYTDTTSGLLKSMGIVDGTTTQGTDAEFTLDGVKGMKRGSNEFTIDGVSYSLKGTSITPASVNVESDMDSVVENIKGFVETYNELVDLVNGKLSEDYDRDYQPLTDEQRDAMSDDEIKSWEKKAKTGLLANDSILSKMVSDMRMALTDKVEGVSISLNDIGISSTSYLDKGKLIIDEDKLRSALSKNYDQVVKLFTNESDVTYKESLSDSTKKSERYKESGLGQRLNDVIQNNIRTTRDSNGQKGILLEKAGYTDGVTEFNNFIADQIEVKDTLISKLEEKLKDKEEWYYKKFSSMETMLSNMESQSSALTSMSGM
jgi:flagellar hook-associated protein 2